MRAFLCHSSADSRFVISVAAHLRRSLDGGIFYYEDHQRADTAFAATINGELAACEIMIIFVGGAFTPWQVVEAQTAERELIEGRNPQFIITVALVDAAGGRFSWPAVISTLRGFPRIEPPSLDTSAARDTAAEIMRHLRRPLLSDDGLPLNPHLFSYEKDIIKFYMNLHGLGEALHTHPPAEKDETEMRNKLLDGCPADWPAVVNLFTGEGMPNRLQPESVGQWRGDEYDNKVLTTAYIGGRDSATFDRSSLHLLEAGPRHTLQFPRPAQGLNVAVLVSGGIAPGTNAVIDAITQRHWLYAETHMYSDGLTIYGFQNGFRAFDNLDRAKRRLAARRDHFPGADNRLETSHHVNEGGSILGTSRVDELIDPASRVAKLTEIDGMLEANNIDILYIIGGDGSMKAAHALFSIAASRRRDRRRRRPLSVVAIPKTMDNDILWVWQSFGFLSAVEKARETIEHLHTEVSSNPRLCVVQLFGSDSGFVVSHAVLASGTGHCCLALIPEVEFSIAAIARYLTRHLCTGHPGIPFGLIVMAETAIPVDALRYSGTTDGAKPEIDIVLSDDEKREIRRFIRLKERGSRIQGQTNDALRTAGLKIVSRGLEDALPDTDVFPGGPWSEPWLHLRMLGSEPRHLLRAVPPSVSDIIIGNRLGTLAVDNAMAGYTDFMISQWLTEYVLVPLQLVVLGRKRIPTSGIFWKSVLAKTGQPPDLLETR